MSDREIREAKALAIVKAIKPKWVNPPPVHTKFEPREFVPFPPPKPDPTFTLLGFPDGTELPAGSIVYFMYSAGRIKIGFSGTIRSRHRGLQNAGPFPPVVLLAIKGTESVEKKFHKQFAKERLHGEWFAISKEMRTYLRQRLCDVGRASFERVETEFLNYCEGFVTGYKPLAGKLKPPKPKPTCQHGVLMYKECYPCARERDLKIVERIKAGTYSQ